VLSLEKINYHENYLGNISKRQLFNSSINKLINGAINIMRNKINLTEVIEKNLYNPTRINICAMVNFLTQHLRYTSRIFI
jgi:hypothetical protein